MQGQDVCFGEELIEVDEFGGRAGGSERVVGDHPAAKQREFLRCAPPDSAVAPDAHGECRHASKFGCGWVPVARADHPIERHDSAKPCQGKTHRMVRHLLYAVVGNVGDLEPEPTCLFDVDVVGAHAKSSDCSEFGARLEKVGRHECPAGHDGGAVRDEFHSRSLMIDNRH